MRYPTAETLKKYGLSKSGWREEMKRGGGRCPICLRKPPDVKLVVDHEHVKGYHKLPPEERRKKIRGLPCRWCNGKYLRRGMTVDVAQRVFMYLLAYDRRVREPGMQPSGDGLSTTGEMPALTPAPIGFSQEPPKGEAFKNAR